MTKSAIKTHIECHNLCYVTATKRSIFYNLELTVNNEKIGIVGRNGVGKTTLLRLLLQELKPSSGEVLVNSLVQFIPQNIIVSRSDAELSVAQYLGVDAELDLIFKAEQGIASAEDCEKITDWTLAEKLSEHLDTLDVKHLAWNRSLDSLSGGEIRKLAIAKATWQQTPFLLLDEPTNDLDRRSREKLRMFLKNWHGAYLLVSHDRELLEDVNGILEILESGVRYYGLKYSEYIAIKAKEDINYYNELKKQEAELHDFTKKAETYETRMHRKQQKSKDEFLALGGDKAHSGFFHDRGQLTTSRTKRILDDRYLQKKEKVLESLTQIRRQNSAKFILSQVQVAPEQSILNVCDLTFNWNTQTPLLNNLNFNIVGPERIWLSGNNGSGKSTLLKLLMQEIEMQQGTLEWHTQGVGYLAQSHTFFEGEISLWQSFMELYNGDEIYVEKLLDEHRFSKAIAQRPAYTLSGGEQIRANLMQLLGQKPTPSCLLLDEPSNNLDLPSLAELERVLCMYQGALIVVSHDINFIKNIHCHREISLDSGS